MCGCVCVALAHKRAPVSGADKWILDSGSGVHVVNRRDVAKLGGHIRPHLDGITLNTVGGPQAVEEEIDVFIPDLGVTVTGLVLPEAPSLLSLGYLCQSLGFAFQWKAFSRSPVIRRPDVTERQLSALG